MFSNQGVYTSVAQVVGWLCRYVCLFHTSALMLVSKTLLVDCSLRKTENVISLNFMSVKDKLHFFVCCHFEQLLELPVLTRQDKCFHRVAP